MPKSLPLTPEAVNKFYPVKVNSSKVEAWGYLDESRVNVTCLSSKHVKCVCGGKQASCRRLMALNI